MVWVLLSFISVVLFCLSARGFIFALEEKRTVLYHPDYSRLAIRLEKNYKIFAWFSLMMFLFWSMASSFVHSFSDVLG